MLPRASICVVLLLVALAASAQAIEPTRIAPAPHQGAPILLQYGDGSAAAGIKVYDDTVNPTGYYSSGSSNNEEADDLHMVAGGILTGFDFGYVKASAGTIGATVRFYAGDPTDLPPTVPIAGPYVLSGLAGSGAHAYHVDVTDTNVLPADVWMSLQLSAAGTSRGPLLYDPPVLGSSHDYWYRTTGTPGYYYFGGAPVANFYLAVYTTTPTPVKPGTWGSIKGLYH